MREFLFHGVSAALEKIVFKALLLAMLIAVSPTAAFAEECSSERLVYVLQGGGIEIRFEGLDLIYRTDKKEIRYATNGNGTGISVRSAFNPDVPDYMNGPYFEVDISDFVKPDAPEHLLIFRNSVFIPECR